MDQYHPNHHHRRSIRLPGYDYSQAGLYFITICCQNRVCLFGEIIHGEMNLNVAGDMANTCWLEIPRHFPNTILHEHVVMPNHIHGIVELTNDAIVGIEMEGIVGVENFQPMRQPQQNEFQKMIPRSIGSIVKGFKIGVTKRMRQEDPGNFPPNRLVWQRNYYEHIIRDEQAFQMISDYIINNPGKWTDDKFHVVSNHIDGIVE